MSKKFSDKNSSKGFIYATSSLIGVAVTFLVMLLFSAIMLLTGIDKAFAVPFATVSLAVGSFAASMYSSSKIGDKGYLIGLITGAVVFVVIMLISLVINRSGLTINTLFHLVIIMLSSVIGGIIGVNKGKDKKYI